MALNTERVHTNRLTERDFMYLRYCENWRNSKLRVRM